MDRKAYQSMSQIEKEHWWFVGRRAILSDMLRSLELPDRADILEVGSGTGGNLELLSGLGRVTGVEPDREARDYSRTAVKGNASVNVIEGTLPENVGAPEASFDLLAMFDVLEHVEDDLAGLSAALKCVRPGGRVVITVPANPSLWSYHDELHHHKRRYDRQSFEQVLTAAGLQIDKMTFFNTVLFLPAWLVRMLRRKASRPRSDVEAVPSLALNWMLTRLFAGERHVLRKFRLPAGLSLLAIATKPGVS